MNKLLCQNIFHLAGASTDQGLTGLIDEAGQHQTSSADLVSSPGWRLSGKGPHHRCDVKNLTIRSDPEVKSTLQHWDSLAFKRFWMVRWGRVVANMAQRCSMAGFVASCIYKRHINFHIFKFQFCSNVIILPNLIINISNAFLSQHMVSNIC